LRAPPQWSATNAASLATRMWLGFARSTALTRPDKSGGTSVPDQREHAGRWAHRSEQPRSPLARMIASQVQSPLWVRDPAAPSNCLHASGVQEASQMLRRSRAAFRFGQVRPKPSPSDSTRRPTCKVTLQERPLPNIAPPAAVVRCSSGRCLLSRGSHLPMGHRIIQSCLTTLRSPR